MHFWRSHSIPCQGNEIMMSKFTTQKSGGDQQVRGPENHPALTVSTGWTVRGSLMDVKRNTSNKKAARIIFKNVIFTMGC